MAKLAAFQADETLVARHGLPSVPLPVRADRLDSLVVDDEVQLDLLADEVAAVLVEEPDFLEAYAAPAARLHFLAGIDTGRSGFAAAAERHFRMGVKLSPQNATLRAHHGLALLGLGRTREAYEEFAIVMAHPEGRFAPGLWLLAARAASDLGEDAEALAILEEYALYLPDDDMFWDLLAQYRENAAGRAGKT